MLLNDFFKIKNIKNGEKYIVSIEMNAEHKIYGGHFPGNPVAPGVCLTQMVKETIEHITGQHLTMTTGDNIKFTAVLNPDLNKNITMTLSIKNKEEGLLYADSSISEGEMKFFSFKGTFKINK